MNTDYTVSIPRKSKQSVHKIIIINNFIRLIDKRGLTDLGKLAMARHEKATAQPDHGQTTGIWFVPLPRLDSMSSPSRLRKDFPLPNRRLPRRSGYCRRSRRIGIRSPRSGRNFSYRSIARSLSFYMAPRAQKILACG